MIGADIIAKTLASQGVKHVFVYPGGTIVYILDAIRRLTKINIITMRSEQGAAFAACAYAKATGDFAVCMATSGPGATNLVTGIADAWCDSQPVLAITGQVPTTQLETFGTRQQGFQYIDIVNIVRPITRYAKTLTDYRLDINVSTAIYMTQMGERSGPVLLDIPIDIQKRELS